MTDRRTAGKDKDRSIRNDGASPFPARLNRAPGIRRTVQTYSSRIRTELDAKSRVEIVAVALRQGASPLVATASRTKETQT
jgi:hypothetical protein